MMGWQTAKRELFVMVSLVEHVPEDRLLRAVDRYLDLSAFRQNAQRSKQKNPYRFGASQYDCQMCPLKAQCCPLC